MKLSHLACFTCLALLALLLRLTCFAFRGYSEQCFLGGLFSAQDRVYERMQGHVRMQSLLIIFSLRSQCSVPILQLKRLSLQTIAFLWSVKHWVPWRTLVDAYVLVARLARPAFLGCGGCAARGRPELSDALVLEDVGRSKRN